MNNILLEEQCVRKYTPQDSLVKNNKSVMYGDWKTCIHNSRGMYIDWAESAPLGNRWLRMQCAGGVMTSAVSYYKNAPDLLRPDFKKITFKYEISYWSHAWTGSQTFTLFGNPYNPEISGNAGGNYSLEQVAVKNGINVVNITGAFGISNPSNEIYLVVNGIKYTLQPKIGTSAEMNFDFEITREKITVFDNRQKLTTVIPYDVSKLLYSPILRMCQTRYKPDTNQYDTSTHKMRISNYEMEA